MLQLKRKTLWMEITPVLDFSVFIYIHSNKRRHISDTMYWRVVVFIIFAFVRIVVPLALEYRSSFLIVSVICVMQSLRFFI